MINLLPNQLKENYKFARRNRHLLHWLWALVAVIAGAIIITGLGLVYLDRAGASYEKQIEASQKRLKEQDYDGIQKQVKDVSDNIGLAVQVLSKQVLFSELIKQIGALMPKDTRLTSLNISQTQGALNITAKARSYPAATQIPVNLSEGEGKKLFNKADLGATKCNNDSDDGYPCTATITVLFADKNPFLFINNTSSTKGAGR